MSLPPRQTTDTTLVLSTSGLAKVTECKPDLMPFHIEYDGPAPVCMYMKVEGIQKRGVGIPDAEGVKMEDGAVDVKVEDGAVDVKVEDGAEDVKMEDGAEGPVKEEGEGVDVTERYVSTFRGRTIHGLDVCLPTGYSGLVLRGGATKRKGKEEVKSEEKGGEIVASGKFSVMRVWGPDVQVDGGRDEYIRGLEEWTSLANEIHREM